MAERAGGVTLGAQPSGAWADIAATWPVKVVSRETPALDRERDEPRKLSSHEGTRVTWDPVTQLHLCCAHQDCPAAPSVLCLSPDASGEPYHVMAADMLAGILAHLRRSHENVVPS
jgi:hypothetical protein